MSWEHGTYGWEKYESFISALEAAGIAHTEEFKAEVFVRGWDLNCACFCGYGNDPNETCPCCRGTCNHKQALRLARFTDTAGKQMVCEEYLAVDDQDCDGASAVAIVVYEQGHRPELKTTVLPHR